MTTQKFTVPELLDLFSKPAEWLVEESELSANTVERNLDMSPEGLRTHWTTAQAIAEVFGLDYQTEIEWPRGLTKNGRLARDGRNCGDERPVIVERTLTVTVTERTTRRKLCDSCRLELPATGVCDDCS